MALLSLGLMAAAVAIRLAPETRRLLFFQPPNGPRDLLLYQHLMHAWFDGVPVYAQFRAAVHPPALFLLLWPIYGWLAETPTRWVFAGITFLSLAGLGILVVRGARPASIRDRALLMGLLLAGYPTAITIGVGQATPLLILFALGGVLVLLGKPPSLGRDAASSALLLFGFAKPNLTAPFLAVALLARGAGRPLLLLAAGYGAATAVSIALHGIGVGDLDELLSDWLHRSGRSLSARGYGNVQSWLGALGLRSWALPASLSVFALHAVWSWRHRKAEPWIAIGVAGIVARVWAYHRAYDDLLMILPLVALYRLARNAPAGTSLDVQAGLLFALGGIALLAPATPLLSPLLAPATPLLTPVHAALVALWLLQLGFLMRQARPATRKAADRTG